MGPIPKVWQGPVGAGGSAEGRDSAPNGTSDGGIGKAWASIRHIHDFIAGAGGASSPASTTLPP